MTVAFTVCQTASQKYRNKHGAQVNINQTEQKHKYVLVHED